MVPRLVPALRLASGRAGRVGQPGMTPLDHLTAAFECLWETKVNLLKAGDGATADERARLQEISAEVAATRDRVEGLLIALQERLAPAPVPPRE